MERAAQGENGAASLSSIPSRPRTALILFGSETGNSQDVAEEVGRMAERLRFATTVLDMDSAQLRDLLKPTVVIFVLSTTGQGEMPQNARVFWKALLSGALKPTALRKVRFSSFGLGDSSYVRFNVAHRMLCRRLTQLGAQEFCQRGEGNEQHPEGHSAGVREWVVALRQALLGAFPLPDGLQPMSDDAFLQPKWMLDLASNDAPATNGAPSAQLGHDGPEPAPSVDPLPIIGSCTASIESNQRVTADDHFQDVRLLDLQIDKDWDYKPGAIAVVYPKNFPQDVQDFIVLMAWGDVADKPLELRSSSDVTPSETTSPLRHLDMSSTKLTLRWLLENVLDIMSIPRRSFFAELAYFAGDSTEDEAYQKERLLELANPELIDELWDYTTRPKRTIVEVMMDFTTLKIPWRYALTLLPLTKGRQFSIASGGALRHCPSPADGSRRTRIQLLVAIAAPPSPIIKYRRRHGVCTRYIAALRPGHTLAIGLQPGYLDPQPSDLDAPALLIGPGTGIAPLRALLHQRLAWARERDLSPADALASDTLIIGARSAHADHFFADEWATLSASAGLTVSTAFSRDGPAGAPRRYVQAVVRERGAAVFDALVRRRGRVYLCGSSGAMPRDVRAALAEALAEHGLPGGEDAAVSYLDSMEREGRFKQETW